MYVHIYIYIHIIIIIINIIIIIGAGLVHVLGRRLVRVEHLVDLEQGNRRMTLRRPQNRSFGNKQLKVCSCVVCLLNPEPLLNTKSK